MKYQLHPQAAFRRVGEDVFVVTDDRALHQFTNATATTVFAVLAEGPASLSGLAEALSRSFEVDRAQALLDLEPFMAILVTRRIATPVVEGK